MSSIVKLIIQKLQKIAKLLLLLHFWFSLRPPETAVQNRLHCRWKWLWLFSLHDSNRVSSHHCFPAQGWCILRMLHYVSNPVMDQYEKREWNAHISWISLAWFPQSQWQSVLVPSSLRLFTEVSGLGTRWPKFIFGYAVYLTRWHFWKLCQDPELAIPLKGNCQCCFHNIMLTDTTGLLISRAWFYQNILASEIERTLICRMRQVIQGHSAQERSLLY